MYTDREGAKRQMAWHEAFRRQMESLLGGESPAFFAALEEAPKRALRLLPSRGDREGILAALAPFLGEKLPFEDAFLLRGAGLGNHPLHAGGAIYLQDGAAMAPAAAVELLPDDAVLDLCAAPGGKSCALGARLGRGGLMVCNEPVPARRRVLMQNLERCGIPAAVTGCDAAGGLPEAWHGRFDLVVCDVPCSGEGMFRKEPDAAALWSPEKVQSCSELQGRILENAAMTVAPGGRLLYATCTWNTRENEAQIARFLREHEDFSLIPPSQAVLSASRRGIELPGFDGENCRRFYPHAFPGEGQFLALLRREGERPARQTDEPRQGKNRADEAPVRAFLEEHLSELPPGELLAREGGWYLTTPFTDAASPGVLLGEVRKGRFVPHHRLFLARHAAFRRTLDLDEDTAKAYLAGMELPCGLPDGWAQVRYLGCPLGGVKVAGGRAKNHYPKGLRLCTTN